MQKGKSPNQIRNRDIIHDHYVRDFLSSRNLLAELITAASDFVGDSIDKYSIAIGSYKNIKGIPILYLFSKNHCLSFYPSLFDGEIEYRQISSLEYDESLLKKEEEAVSFGLDEKILEQDILTE